MEATGVGARVAARAVAARARGSEMAVKMVVMEGEARAEVKGEAVREAGLEEEAMVAARVVAD